MLFTISTFNPSMMETACFYFCLDMDLLPETVNANSLDYVDIHAFPLAEEEQIFEKFNKHGIKLSKKIKDKFKRDKIFQFQCKAYKFNPTNDDSNELLHFLPRKESDDQMNVIGIQNLDLSDRNLPKLKNTFKFKLKERLVKIFNLTHPKRRITSTYRNDSGFARKPLLELKAQCSPLCF